MPPTQKTHLGMHLDTLALRYETRQVGAAALVIADSVDVMAALPAESIDVVFADPPYLLSRGGTTVKSGRRVSVDKGEWDRARGGVDAEHGWHRRWLRSAQRVLRPSGTIWVCGHYQSIWSLGWAMQSLGFHLLNSVTWCKPNASPNFGCRAMTHSTEMILWATPRHLDPSPHFFDYQAARVLGAGPDGADKQLRDFWTLPAGAPAAEKRHGPHPTQKPRALIDRAFKVSLPPGGTVLDPFMGSGTTATAAVAAGVGQYIGVDLDRQWVTVAAQRLEDGGP